MKSMEREEKKAAATKATTTEKKSPSLEKKVDGLIETVEKLVIKVDDIDKRTTAPEPAELEPKVEPAPKAAELEPKVEPAPKAAEPEPKVEPAPKAAEPEPKEEPKAKPIPKAEPKGEFPYIYDLAYKFWNPEAKSWEVTPSIWAAKAHGFYEPVWAAYNRSDRTINHIVTDPGELSKVVPR